MEEIVAPDRPHTGEETALETDLEIDIEERRESSITLVTQEAETEIIEREDPPVEKDLLAIPSDDLPHFMQKIMFKPNFLKSRFTTLFTLI